MTTTMIPYFLEDDRYVKIGKQGYYVLDSAPEQVKRDFEEWISRIRQKNMS